MQQATGITEHDYGVMFDDTAHRTGSVIHFDAFSNARVEVELAFVLHSPLEGPDCALDDVLRATEYAVPALELLNSHIELEGRTIVDTIADNAAYGAMVLGEVHKRPDEIDLRWVRVFWRATARSTRRVSRPASSGTPRPASRGSPTSSTSTEPDWRRGRSSSPDRLPGRCGCPAGITCTATSGPWA